MAEVDDGMASLGRERTVNQEDEVERSEDQTPEKVEAAQVSHQLKSRKDKIFISMGLHQL